MMVFLQMWEQKPSDGKWPLPKSPPTHTSKARIRKDTAPRPGFFPPVCCLQGTGNLGNPMEVWGRVQRQRALHETSSWSIYKPGPPPSVALELKVQSKTGCFSLFFPCITSVPSSIPGSRSLGAVNFETAVRAGRQKSKQYVFSRGWLIITINHHLAMKKRLMKTCLEVVLLCLAL